MADYEPPEADSDDDDSDDGKAKGKSAKKPKAKKDPNAPKVSFHSCLVCDIMLLSYSYPYLQYLQHITQKPMNAYMLFSNSVRDEIKAENPDFKMGDIVSSSASNIC